MDRSTLERRLERARRRVESDVPYSPDWAAAVAELEELEAVLTTEPDAHSTQVARPQPLSEATAA